MSPAEIAAAVRARLAAELTTELASLDKLASSIAALRGAASEPTRSLAIAFQLERYYTALESILARVLRTIDGDVPGGAASHQALLMAASVPIEGLRAAVLSPEALAPLRELLAFRRYARHGYDVEPKAPRVDEMAALVAGAHSVVTGCVRSFQASLLG